MVAVPGNTQSDVLLEYPKLSSLTAAISLTYNVACDISLIENEFELINSKDKPILSDSLIESKDMSIFSVDKTLNGIPKLLGVESK